MIYLTDIEAGIISGIIGAIITYLILKWQVENPHGFIKLEKAGFVHYNCKKCGCHIWSKNPVEYCSECSGEGIVK